MHSENEIENIFDVSYDDEFVCDSKNIADKPRIHKYCQLKYFKDEECADARNVQTGGVSHLRQGCGHWGGLVSSVSN